MDGCYDYTTGRVSQRCIVLWESLVSMIEEYPWMGVNNLTCGHEVSREHKVSAYQVRPRLGIANPATRLQDLNTAGSTARIRYS